MRAVPERRAPHPGRVGLHAEVQRGAVLGVPAPRARIYPPEASAGLAERAPAGQADSSQLHGIFLLTVAVVMDRIPFYLSPYA